MSKAIVRFNSEKFNNLGFVFFNQWHDLKSAVKKSKLKRSTIYYCSGQDKYKKFFTRVGGKLFVEIDGLESALKYGVGVL